MKCPCCSTQLRAVTLAEIGAQTVAELVKRWPGFRVVANPLLSCDKCESAMLQTDWDRLQRDYRGLPNGDK